MSCPQPVPFNHTCLAPLPHGQVEKEQRQQQEKQTKTTKKKPVQAIPGPAIAPAPQPEKPKPLYCCQCQQPITHSLAKITVQTVSHYTRFNPFGIVYAFDCFQQAPGCQLNGPISHEFSWFPGYSWQVAACQCCQTHLGWFFTSPTHDFYALISKTLTASTP